VPDGVLNTGRNTERTCVGNLSNYNKTCVVLHLTIIVLCTPRGVAKQNVVTESQAIVNNRS
jgi:DhnA family fructose-bisphosphate aldolase class Ia